jgi:hypothetical protein
MAPSRFVVDEADRLIAVWDGEPARAFGGTADVVAYAREKGRLRHDHLAGRRDTVAVRPNAAQSTVGAISSAIRILERNADRTVRSPSRPGGQQRAQVRCAAGRASKAARTASQPDRVWRRRCGILRSGRRTPIRRP